MSVSILDCTLRDGGYVNNWQFSDKEVLNTISKLLDANIEIIECGFLDATTKNEEHNTRFKNIEKLETLVQDIKINNKQKLVAMIEFSKYDIDSLPQVTESSKIKGIRFSFRKSDFEAALLEMPKIKAKGYELFVQPISTLSYTKYELENLLQTINILKPYAVYIVDTQGSMFGDEFRVLYEHMNFVLDKSILLGFHSHNNMQLSYSIAISFIELAKDRNIVIDASVYGMGRGAGNLNTELLADYINKKIVSKYYIEDILELIDSYYYAIYKIKGWGYSLAHFLSASLECHPNYASFLLDTKHLSINEIKYIMSKVPENEKYEYNKQCIEKLYIEYNQSRKESINEPSIAKDKKVLLLGSGKNLNQKIDEIIENKADYFIIALNHKPKEIVPDYYFFSSQKRYNEFHEGIDNQKVIVSNNIKSKAKYIIDYKKYSQIEEFHNDNSAVMMINFLIENKFEHVDLAGVDGFSSQQANYNYDEKDSVVDVKSIHELNSSIQNAIQVLSKFIRVQFITLSVFESKSKPKVIGVIPARYSSTRLPGKPLRDISGLPMIIHVWKRSMMSNLLDDVIVATDDIRIYNEVEKYGGKAMMTSADHDNATTRLYEVSKNFKADIYVLILGDEALVKPNHIDASVKSLSSNKKYGISLLFNKFYKRNSPSDQKVMINKFNEIMCISRSDIPSNYRNEVEFFYKAYFIVSITYDMLQQYMQMEQTPYDKIESNEFTRILEHGYKILGVEVDSTGISVDTEEDLEFVRSVMAEDSLFLEYKDSINV